MSDIPSFPYELLWGERVIRSVANLTRRDGEEFLALAPRVPVRTEVETFPLADANDALDRLRCRPHPRLGRAGRPEPRAKPYAHSVAFSATYIAAVPRPSATTPTRLPSSVVKTRLPSR